MSGVHPHREEQRQRLRALQAMQIKPFLLTAEEYIDHILWEDRMEDLKRELNLVDLLTHPKWPVRLGAMVAMEALIESDPALSRTIVPLLMKRFDAFDEQTKGDALYILGEAGDQETLALLRRMPLDGAGAELHQAAREAAESITARIGNAARRPT